MDGGMGMVECILFWFLLSFFVARPNLKRTVIIEFGGKPRKRAFFFWGGPSKKRIKAQKRSEERNGN